MTHIEDTFLHAYFPSLGSPSSGDGKCCDVESPDFSCSEKASCLFFLFPPPASRSKGVDKFWFFVM